MLAADLPRPDLHGHQVRAPRTAWAAVPAVPHRALLGPLRRGGDAGRVPAARRGPHQVPRRRHQGGRRRLERRDAPGRRGRGVRIGGTIARPAGQPGAGRRAPAGRHERPRGPRRGRHHRRTRSRRPSGLPRPPGPHRRPAGLHRGQGRGPDPGPPGRPGPRPALRRGRRSARAERRRGPTAAAGRRGRARPCGGPTGRPIRACPAGPRARAARRHDAYTALLARTRAPVARGCRSAGHKRALMESVDRNAGEELVRHRPGGPPTTTAGSGRSRRCRATLGLPVAPLRIECYDMSHLQGSDYVGSMVVLEDGLPRRRTTGGSRCATSRQRRLRGHGGGAHPAAEALLDRAGANAGGHGRPPALRLPAAAAAARRGQGPAQRGGPGARDLGLDRRDPRRGPGQEFEEVFVPGRPDPVRIPRGSDALFLLQRVRDEAHRFAITYHRQVRGKGMTKSALEGVPGLGPGRRARLLRQFGSLKALRAATARGAAGLCPGCPTPWPGPSSPTCTPWPPGSGRRPR